MRSRKRATQLLLLSISLSVAFCFPLAVPDSDSDERVHGPEAVLERVSLDMAGQVKDGESVMSLSSRVALYTFHCDAMHHF